MLGARARPHRWPGRVPFFGFALALLLPACGGRALREGSAAPPIDAAGLELPVRVGPYVASVVHYSGDPDQGAFVRYVGGDPLRPLPRIDVVVYPAHGHELPEEIALSHEDLLEADRSSPAIDRTTLLAGASFRLEGAEPAYRATYYVTVRNVPQRFLVYLQSRGQQVLKARASFPLHPGFDPSGDVDAAVAELFATRPSAR